MGSDEFNAGGDPATTEYPIQAGEEILLVAYFYNATETGISWAQDYFKFLITSPVGSDGFDFTCEN